MRRYDGTTVTDITAFQSTHPLRGATEARIYSFAKIFISIHAPLAGCDLAPELKTFYDTISIHAPLAGCDRQLLIVFIYC